MSTAPIDWSQLWYPGPTRRFTAAAEMARAGAEPPSTTLKAVLGVNIGLLGAISLQFAPARHMPMLAAGLPQSGRWAVARWLWWCPGVVRCSAPAWRSPWRW
jgi:hypothetical protein